MCVCVCLRFLITTECRQTRLRAEIDALCGPNRPTYTDLMERSPYLAACLEESQRLDPVGLWVSRVTTQEVELCGFTLPTGTTVIVNNYSMSRSPSLFVNPTSFQPERFLSGHSIAANAHVPFGVGLRSCQGQRLARLETCYVIVRLLQHFNLETRSDGRQFAKSVQFTLTPHVACRFVARREQ